MSVLGARALSSGTLEFFLKVINRICDKLDLPLAVGSTALGRRLGDGETAAHLLQTVRGWQHWNQQERGRVRGAKLFFVPVCWDPGAEQKQDWVLAEVSGSSSMDVDEDCLAQAAAVAAGDGGGAPSLEDAVCVVVRIHDALGRDHIVAWMFPMFRFCFYSVIFK